MQPIVLINQRVQNAVVYIAVGSIAMLIVALIIVMAKDKARPIMDNVLRRYDFFIFMKASVGLRFIKEMERDGWLPLIHYPSCLLVKQQFFTA